MRPKVSTVVFFGVVVSVLAFVGRSKLLADADTFWHLEVGRSILEDRKLPTVDRYSYSAEGRPWLANQWLAECGMALLDRRAGFDGLLLFFIIVLGGYYTWLAERWRRRGADLLVAGLAMALVFLASAYNLLARPHVATMVFLPALYASLLDVDAGRRRIAALAWWPPLFCLWANLHGGVLAGIGTYAIVAAGWVVTRALGRPSPLRSTRDVVAVAAVGVAACGALGVNPYGSELFVAWRRILEMDLPNLVIEHARLDPRTPEGISVLAAGGLLAAVFFASPRESRWKVVYWTAFVWWALAISRIRHAPLFAGVGALAAAELLPKTGWVERLRRRGYWRGEDEAGAEEPAQGRFWRAAAAVASIGLLGWLMGGTVERAGTAVWARPATASWPAELETELDALPRPAGRPLRVFNESRYGGYLIYRYPERRVFIDGRCELYGEPFLRTYQAAKRDEVLRRGLTETNPADAALVKTDSGFDRQLQADSGWRLVRRGVEASLYVRRGAALE